VLVALAACGTSGSTGQSATAVATKVTASTTTVAESTSTTAAASTTTTVAYDINSLAPGPGFIAHVFTCKQDDPAQSFLPCKPAPMAACTAEKGYNLLSASAKAKADAVAASNGASDSLAALTALRTALGNDELGTINQTVNDCIHEGVNTITKTYDMNSLAPGPRLIADALVCKPNQSFRPCQPEPMAACAAQKIFTDLASSPTDQAQIDAAAAAGAALPSSELSSVVAAFLFAENECTNEGVIANFAP
jgi:hypothetical protein